MSYRLMVFSLSPELVTVSMLEYGLHIDEGGIVDSWRVKLWMLRLHSTKEGADTINRHMTMPQSLEEYRNCSGVIVDGFDEKTRAESRSVWNEFGIV